MIFLLAIDAMSAPYGVALELVGAAGFVAATVLGSIAWYNSKS